MDEVELVASHGVEPEVHSTVETIFQWNNKRLNSAENLHSILHESAAYTSEQNVSTAERTLRVYRDAVHCPLGVSLCAIAVAFNVLTCVVLRKRQILVAGNMALLAVCFCYLVMSCTFLLLLITLFCVSPHSAPKVQRNTYTNMLIAVICSQLQLTAHAIQLWLGVLMAFQRLICITTRVPIQHNRLVSERATRLSILLIVIAVVATSTPSYLMSYIAERRAHTNQSVVQQVTCRNHSNASQNSTVFNSWSCTEVSQVIELPSCVYYVVMVRSTLGTPAQWVHIVLHKLLPCVLMVLLSIVLSRSLRHLVDRRKFLMNRRSITGVATTTITNANALEPCETYENAAQECGEKRPTSLSETRLRAVNRSVTWMLIMIVLMMVLTQLPPAILLVVNRSVYRRYGDAFDILSMVNNMASFVLYCKTSVAFRTEFFRLLRCTSLRSPASC